MAYNVLLDLFRKRMETDPTAATEMPYMAQMANAQPPRPAGEESLPFWLTSGWRNEIQGNNSSVPNTPFTEATVNSGKEYNPLYQEQGIDSPMYWQDTNNSNVYDEEDDIFGFGQRWF